MPVFVSIATGNHEVWEEKPRGYIKPEEWFSAHKTEIESAEIKKQITGLKQSLAETDYKELGFLAGRYTETEFEPVKIQRQSMRDRINKLEDDLKWVGKDRPKAPAE